MNKTILIIDDDDILRKTLAHGLRNENFYVLTANSAETGQEILDKIKVDAIVLDRMMTGQDGLSFLKKMRQNGNNTPVIMLTAMTGPENAIDGLSNGADDYLAKPFQLKELVLRINNIIKKQPITNSQLPKGLTFIDDEFFFFHSIVFEGLYTFPFYFSHSLNTRSMLRCRPFGISLLPW